MDRQKVSYAWPNRLVAILAVLYLILYYYREKVFQFTVGDVEYFINLSFILGPLLPLIGFFYVANLLEKLFEGRLVETLVDGLQATGMTFSLLRLSSWPYVPPFAERASYFVTYIILLSSLRNVVNSIPKKENTYITAITNSIFVVVFGHLTSDFFLEYFTFIEKPLLEALSHQNPQLLELMVAFIETGLVNTVYNQSRLAYIIVALLSLTGIFKDHSNHYISNLINRLSRKLPLKIVTIFTILFYIRHRQYLASILLGESFWLQSILEWGAVSVIAIFMFQSLIGSIKPPEPIDIKGLFNKHIQEVELVRNLNFDFCSELVDGFIEMGEKEWLIVYLTDLFLRSGSSKEHIVSLLKDLISYEEVGLGLIVFSWQKDWSEAVNREKRAKILRDIVENMDRPYEPDQFFYDKAREWEILI